MLAYEKVKEKQRNDCSYWPMALVLLANRKIESARINVSGVNTHFSTSVFANIFPTVFSANTKNMIQRATRMTDGENLLLITPAFIKTMISMSRFTAVAIVSSKIIWLSFLILPPPTIVKGIIP